MTILQEILETFPSAILAGLIIASACSFLGTLVVLKRLVFIGATLSEVATCGIAAGFFFHFHPMLGAMGFTLLAVTLLAFISGERRIPRDAILAILFILSASLSILLVSGSAVGFDEVKSLLYGDLVITSAEDLKILLITVVPLALGVLIFIRPIVYTFVDRDEAKVLGLHVRFWELLFYYVLGIVVSAASKLGGMLLVFCYLVVPPAIGLLMSNRLRNAFLISVASAIFSTLIGFTVSYVYDLPTNPVIALVSCVLLGISFLLSKFGRRT